MSYLRGFRANNILRAVDPGVYIDYFVALHPVVIEHQSVVWPANLLVLEANANNALCSRHRQGRTFEVIYNFIVELSTMQIEVLLGLDELDGLGLLLEFSFTHLEVAIANVSDLVELS